MKNIFSLILLYAVVVLTSCSKEDSVVVNTISLNKPFLELTEGFSETLVASIAPDNADNKNIIWSSSNKAVITVTDAGKVMAVSEGTATITAKTADGGKEATCQVTVTPKIATVALLIPDALLNVNENVANGTVEIPITMSNTMLGEMFCTVETWDGTAISTGSDWDYKLVSAEVKIEKGAKEGKVIIDINDFEGAKEERSFLLRMVSVSSSCENEEISIEAPHSQCEVVIKKVPYEGGFSQATITANKQMSPLDFNIYLTRPAKQDVAIAFGVKDPGTLIENEDFKFDTQSLIIKAGKTSVSTKLIILKDVEGSCILEIKEVAGGADISETGYECSLVLQKSKQ